MESDLYARLFTHYGPQGWWPLLRRAGEPGFNAKGYHPGVEPVLTPGDRFEIAVGAVLTQNTSWSNVRSALQTLLRYADEQGNGMSPHTILSMGQEKCAELIRSSGYYNQKARKLLLLSSFLSERKTAPEREELLNLWGIGPETADSILLYAFDRPVFVIDAYTRRIHSRIMGLSTGPTVAEYHRLQKIFTDSVPAHADTYREYHALLVIHAKQVCTKNRPACSRCPVKEICRYVVDGS